MGSLWSLDNVRITCTLILLKAALIIRLFKLKKVEFLRLIPGIIILPILMFMPSTFAFVGTKYICDRIPELTPRQRNMCYSNPAAIVSIDEGSYMGLQECHRQFKHSRWNCKLLRATSTLGYDQKMGTKEAAYDSAIRAAGVLHAIATACAEGHLRECGCDTSKRGYFRWDEVSKWTTKIRSRDNSRVQSWTWGGCSVDIKRAMRLSRDAWDSREVSSTPRSVMNLHNYEVGRKAVLKKLKIQCKCHGVSASCTTNTCWITLPNFREVGNILASAYSKSRKVTYRFHPHFSLRYPKLVYMKGENVVKPLKRELIHLDASPLYCEYNTTTGSQGTVGRICRMASEEDDNCEHLCCGRGYKSQEKIRKWDCKCKFFWCCHVECQQCEEITMQYVCL